MPMLALMLTAAAYVPGPHASTLRRGSVMSGATVRSAVAPRMCEEALELATKMCDNFVEMCEKGVGSVSPT